MADFDERAIRLDPALAIAYSNRGLVYARKSDKVRAIADYDKAIQVDPNMPLPTSTVAWPMPVPTTTAPSPTTTGR